jgi:hypothetical protein
VPLTDDSQKYNYHARSEDKDSEYGKYLFQMCNILALNSAKWSVKSLSVCDSKTEFFCKFGVCTGRSMESEDTAESLGEQVVLKMFRGLRTKDMSPFCPCLLQELRTNSIGICVTVRPIVKGLPID